jgi:hypothetical protein
VQRRHRQRHRHPQNALILREADDADPSVVDVGRGELLAAFDLTATYDKDQRALQLTATLNADPSRP